MNKFDKKAFTLAELLVAMFVFAFIAVLLIPNVTQNAEKSLFTTQLKKVQNDIQQALLVMMSQNQGTLQALCSGDNPSTCFRNELAKKLEYRVTYGGTDELKDSCGDNDKSEWSNDCKQKEAYEARDPVLMDKTTQASYNVNNADSYTSVNLKNGATVSVVFDPNCKEVEGRTDNNTTKANSYELNASLTATVTTAPAKLCGYMEVDTNAAKEPNMVGKDIHYFWIIDKDGIVPFGEIDTFTCGNDVPGGNYQTPKQVGISAENTLGCTYRLIQEGRIDYY